MIFDQSILSRCHKSSDADPTDTLDSCSRTQDEQKNTQSTVIELEIRTLSSYVSRIPSHANSVSKNFAIFFIHFLGTVSNDYLSSLLTIAKSST